MRENQYISAVTRPDGYLHERKNTRGGIRVVVGSTVPRGSDIGDLDHDVGSGFNGRPRQYDVAEVAVPKIRRTIRQATDCRVSAFHEICHGVSRESRPDDIAAHERVPQMIQGVCGHAVSPAVSSGRLSRTCWRASAISTAAFTRTKKISQATQFSCINSYFS